MYMKKIHQFLSSTKKKHEKRKLVLFFCLTVYIKLHRFMGAHQRNKVVKNLAMSPPPKKKQVATVLVARGCIADAFASFCE